MADVFDQAQERDLQQLAEARKWQQAKAEAEPKLLPAGECRNPLCGEPLEGAQLFCGPSCAQEHAKRVK